MRYYYISDPTKASSRTNYYQGERNRNITDSDSSITKRTTTLPNAD